nr:PREDICTED: uncharacterized protein LOC105676396 isoform X2 [Linepithema humile]
MIQSFRRDVRSITGATHKGTLKHKQPSLLLGFLIVFAITWMAFTRVIPMERWVLTLHELQREDSAESALFTGDTTIVLEEEIPAVAKTTPEAERFAFTIEDVVLAGSTPQVSPAPGNYLRPKESRKSEITAKLVAGVSVEANR